MGRLEPRAAQSAALALGTVVGDVLHTAVGTAVVGTAAVGTGRVMATVRGQADPSEKLVLPVHAVVVAVADVAVADVVAADAAADAVADVVRPLRLEEAIG